MATTTTDIGFAVVARNAPALSFLQSRRCVWAALDAQVVLAGMPVR